MIVYGTFALLRPWWLIALPVFCLLLAVTRPRGGVLVGWPRVVDPALLTAMGGRGGVSGGGGGWPATVLAVIIAIIALSGPAVPGPDTSRLRNLDAILIVMDLSQDATETASLREASSAAHEVLDHAGARQAGLILYAGDAYLASPLTDDTNAIDPLLFVLDDKTVPDPGARPQRGLALADKILREAHILSGEVVLISSGAGLDGDGTRAAAAALHAAGHRVSTLFVPDTNREPAAETLRSAALASVGAAGGGVVADVGHLAGIDEALSAQTLSHLGSRAIVAIGWRDLGRYLLIAAAVPLLLGFRRVTS